MPARIDFRPAAPFQRQRGDPPAKVRRDGSDGWCLQRRRSAGLGWHARADAQTRRTCMQAPRETAATPAGPLHRSCRGCRSCPRGGPSRLCISAAKRLSSPPSGRVSCYPARPLAPAHSHASAGPTRHIETKAEPETKPHPPREHRSTSRRCASSTTATMTPRAPHRARQTTRGPHAAHHCMRAIPRRLVPTRIDTPRRLAPSASSPSRPSPYRRGSSRPARHRFRCRTGAPRSLARSRSAARAARRRA